MSRDEITESFDLDGLGLSSAMFDIERLQEMNARYIRDLDPSDFLRRGRPHLEARVQLSISDDALDRLLPIATAIQERVKLMPEFADYTDFFFTTGPLDYGQCRAHGSGLQEQALGSPSNRSRLRSRSCALSTRPIGRRRASESILRESGHAARRKTRRALHSHPCRHHRQAHRAPAL